MYDRVEQKTKLWILIYFSFTTLFFQRCDQENISEEQNGFPIQSHRNNNEVNDSVSVSVCDKTEQFNEEEISVIQSDFSFNKNADDANCISFMDFDDVHSEFCEIDIDCFQKIHENLECSVKDAMNMIYAYSVRYSLTWRALEDLVRLINTIVKTDNLIPSKYLFKKMYEKKDSTKPVVHFWCDECNKYLGTKSELQNSNICKNCGSVICKDTKYKKNHFVYIPIENHLKNVLERNSQNMINNNENPNSGVISDVHHSTNFQKLKREMGNDPYITLLVYSDGAAIFKSTKDKSFWPINITINEIDLEHRFDRSNILCSSISFGKSPNMQVFFKPLIDEIKSINRNGGVTFRNKYQELKTVKVIPMIFTADALAKASVLNIVQHNGYNGCPYCLHPGTRIDGSNQIRYCIEDNARCRTNAESRSNMIEAHMTGSKINGYNGLSPLMAISKDFDVVWQVVIDKMHCVDMGIIKKMFGLFLNSKNSNER